MVINHLRPSWDGPPPVGYENKKTSQLPSSINNELVPVPVDVKGHSSSRNVFDVVPPK